MPQKQVGATAITPGGIDLSVGSVFSLAGMITGLALVHNYDEVSSTIAGLLVGLVFGAINGALVTFVGLAPFVVTLITYAVAGSLAFIVTQANPNYYLLNGGTLIPGIPNFVLYCLILPVIEEFVLRKVVLGRWIYAVGSSSNAARLLGVPVRGIRLSVYIVSGLLASFASVLDVSYISNAEATAGSAMMLQSIAAVVIGGASLFGGTGSAVGALLGALMITVIQNGVNLIGINSFWQGSVTSGHSGRGARRPRYQGQTLKFLDERGTRNEAVHFTPRCAPIRNSCLRSRCHSAWNKDPVFGVIGIQSGPRG